MIVEKPAFSSDVVALAGGGLAVEIDSDGSRNKFHIIAQLEKLADGFMSTAYINLHTTL